MRHIVVSILFLSVFLNCLFSQEKEIIVVQTNGLSMIFSAVKNEKVAFQYWGDRINETSAFKKKVFKRQPDSTQDTDTQLYPAYGGKFYLNPAIRLTHSDGVLTTELVYTGSENKILDDNRIETIIHLKDNLYPVIVDIRFLAFQKENIISQSVTVINEGKKNLSVENLASTYIPLHAQSYYLTHFHGTWAAEMQMKEEKLTPGVKVIESKKGVRATQSENPSFLVSLNGPAQENSGEVYAGSLAWSGNFALSFELDESGLLNILGGINPFASTYHLQPKQKLETPGMILTYSSKGKGQITRNYHDWSRKYALAHGTTIRPIILNSWEENYYRYD